MRLLLVEDDTMIGESIEEELREQGYAVDWVRDGTAAELALQTHDYDLVLLDLGLPRKQGLEVLTGYRRRGGETPVVIITARDAVDDRVKGLDAGSDDYLVKPFDLEELNARVRALLRRRVGRANPEIRYHELVLNPATHEVHYRGQLLNLSSREFAVLHALMDPPGEVVPRKRLEEKLYSWGEEVESNTLDVFIHHLRKKLDADLIRTVRGVGFKLANKP
ncbi:MAG: response regulator [Gammaproteobacteria bacterium]|nr:response regulator [Gammaproteobacteria bacterium]